jgi:uncharacterized RmlC-like cupin family protein
MEEAMKLSRMKIVQAIGVGLGYVILTGMAGGEAGQAAPEYISGSSLDASVSAASEAPVAHSATADPASRTLIVRRSRSGDVELHENSNDVTIARAGSAVMIMGGRVEGDHVTSPGEHLGGTIIGGQRFDLHPGDVLWIPAGVPHQMILPEGGSFTYLVVKSDAAS